MDRSELVANTKNAYMVVQGLYDEVAALVRSLETIFADQPEKFMINQPYGVAIRGSKGLDPSNCKLWPYRKFGLFFVSRDGTRVENSQTVTELSQPVLYLRFVLDDYESVSFSGTSFSEPFVLFGTFMQVKGSKSVSKVEKLPTHLEYNESKAFSQLPAVNYSDGRVDIHGEFGSTLLFDLTDTEAVVERLAAPALALFRRHHGAASTD